MDSLIHYEPHDKVEMIARLASRASRGMAFTFAPGTPLLRLMRVMGKVLPRGHRSPSIVPIAEAELQRRITEHPSLRALQIGRSERIDTAFYKSQAMELVRR